MEPTTTFQDLKEAPACCQQKVDASFSVIFNWRRNQCCCDQRKSKCDQMRAKKELAVLLELSIKKHDSVIVSTCECDKERIKGETLLNIWLFSHQNVIVYSESWEITTERRRKPELDRYLNKNLTHVKQNEQNFCTHKIYIISSLYLLS